MDPIRRLERWVQASSAKEKAECPWVTVAYAQSLDGSIAARRGQPLALSGPEASHLTHRLRAAHDAILVGIGTVLADDPRLTARGVEGAQPQPVILDAHLRTPVAARLFDHPKPPWIAATAGAPQDRRARLLEKRASLLEFQPDSQGLIPLEGLLAQLWDRGVRRLMVEGGAKVITNFLEANRVDGIVVTLAPVFVGGLPVLERPLTREVSDITVERCGKDIVIWGRMA